MFKFQFKPGQTVTRTSITGQQTHGLVISVYMHSGREKVQVVTGFKIPPLTFDASELTPYVLQSPDVVIVKDDDGALWSFEVLDFTADETGIIVKHDGRFGVRPVESIIRIIPASFERIKILVGEA